MLMQGRTLDELDEYLMMLESHRIKVTSLPPIDVLLSLTGIIVMSSWLLN
jgi:hypothetical protein